MKTHLFALAGLCAAGIVLGASVAYRVSSSEPPGSSPTRTVYSFVYSLRHGNFGRACSYEKTTLTLRDCKLGFLYNEAMGLLSGYDTFGGVMVKPGSENCPSTSKCVYTVVDPTGSIGSAYITVEKQKDGRWRVTGAKGTK